MTRTLRWLAPLLALMILGGSLPTAGAQTSEGGPAPVPAVPKQPASLKVPPLAEARSPSLTLHMEIEPKTLRRGDQATVSLTVTNQSPHAATDVAITLPVPESTTPIAQGDAHSGPRAWRWRLQRLPGRSAQVVQARLQLTNDPPGEALLLRPELTAHELAGPVHEVGGALVESPDAEAFASLAAGRSTELRSADRRVEVAVPAGASDTDLRLSYRSAVSTAQRAPKSPAPPAIAGFRQGLGTFFLEATDAGGKAVHQFARPLTIKVRYTPQQLEALGISAADLTLFSFDETAQRWLPNPTVVDDGNHQASAQVDHFSAFQLSEDGWSPSQAFVPSVQGWQVGPYTGNASFSYPFDVPSGPGGMKPDLELRYNSASTDGRGGLRPKQQAGWVGKGWSLETGSVSANKLPVGGQPYYSLVLNGESYDLVRAEPLVPNPAESHIDHWAWRSVDESFVKVRVVEVGDSTPDRGGFHSGIPYKRYMWQLWKKDGTRFDFGKDRWWGFNDCAPEGGYAEMETYSWNLSKVEDTHGNTISYAYGGNPKPVSACLGVRGTVDPAVWPTAITWGGNRVTGDIDRYQVQFLSNRRENDIQFEDAKNQLGGINGQPRETQRLDRIRVLSMPNTTWELVREYRFDYDYSLLSDRTVVRGSSFLADTEFRKLTLTRIQRFGQDGVSALPAMTFAYGLERGKDQYPRGDWNRLIHVDNGQGGTIDFDYDTIAGVNGQGAFQNNRRVTSKTQSDGRGNRYTWSYTYNGASYNSLGSILQPGAPQPYTNSAALYYAKNWDPLHENDNMKRLLHKPYSEFRGHSSVAETDPNGTKTVHLFHQGDVGCNPTATGGRITSDPCFLQLRDREILKGKEYRTVVNDPGGKLMTEDLHTFAVEFYTYGATPLSGLWSSFNYESEAVNNTWEGATSPITKRTRFVYDPALQGGVQAGNLTNRKEYVGSTLYRQREFRYVRLDTSTSYIVDRRIAEGVKDGAGALLALTNSAYDGNTIPWAPLSKGDLTLVRKYQDIPPSYVHGTTTIHSADTSYAFDTYGNRTAVTTYAASGTRLGNIFGPPGNGSTARTTTTAYDDLFHVFPVKITPPLVSVDLSRRSDYDLRMGTLVSVTDANNVTTSARYDPFARVVKLIKPGDTERAATIDAYYFDQEIPFRHVICLREIAGQPGCRPIQSFYDGFGQHIQTKAESMEASQNIIVDKVYDGLGQAVKESQPRYRNETLSTTFWQYVPPTTDAEMRWTTTSYDSLSRPTLVVQPGGRRTEHQYTVAAAGSTMMAIHGVMDANRHRSQQRFDALGRLIEAQELSGECDNTTAHPCGVGDTPWALHARTIYTYGPLDLLTSVTDNQGNRTTMTWDSLGRKVSMADPDMGGWNYSHDPNGNLVAQTDAKGKTITFRYDALDRLTAKIFADGTESTSRYDGPVPNGKGRRTSMSTASETTTWQYDARGRRTLTNHTIDGVTRTFQRTFDSADRVETITYPSGEQVIYHYDAAWRPLSLCTTGGCYVQAATWTALDQPDTRKYGNSLLQDWNYENPTQLLAQLSVAGHFNRSYRYDLGSNVKSITDNLPSGASQSFAYDAQDRLVSWSPSAGAPASTYAYDSIDNLVSKDGQAYDYGVRSPFNGGPHAVKTKGNQTYRYDAAGNLLSGGGREITWNAENLPDTVKGPDGVTERYRYDAEGARVQKVRAGVKTTYLEGLWEEVAGGPSKTYYEFNGEVVAMRQGRAVTYLHGDHLGSVAVATDQSGALVSRQDFDPWGGVRSGGINHTDLNYTGQRLDGTGLLYYNARMYDPALGRFISADTVVPMPGMSSRSLTTDFHETAFLAELNRENRDIGQRGFYFQQDDTDRRRLKSPWGPADPAHLNRYSYASNDPLSYTDPSGHVKYNKNKARKVEKFLRREAIPDLQKIRNVEKITWAAAAGAAGGVAGVAGGMAGAGIGGAAGGAVGAGLVPDTNGTQEAIDTLDWMANQLEDFRIDAPADATIEFYFYSTRDGTVYLVADTRSKSGDLLEREKIEVSPEFRDKFIGSIGSKSCMSYRASRCPDGN